MSEESLAYEATDEATFRSKRKGNWSTPSEIKARLNKPIHKNLVSVLNELTEDKKIQKKKDAVMYRTRKGGAGGFGNLNGLDGRSGNDYTPPSGRGSPDSPRGTTEDTVRAGIGAMLGGSVAGATGTGTGSVPSVPR